MFTVSHEGKFSMVGPDGFLHEEFGGFKTGGLSLADARAVEDALSAGEGVSRGKLGEILASKRGDSSKSKK